MAANGATMMATSVPIRPMRPLSLRWPPKSMPNCSMLATIEIAPAMAAATVMVSVSRFLMCVSSWAMTPATSSRSSMSRRPVEAQTAAWDGLRPVAKALGCGLSII